MKFTYKGTNEKLIRAVGLANTIYSNPLFFVRIAEIPGFAYSSYTGQQVATEMREVVSDIPVTTYWNPLTRVTAKTLSEISVNTAKLNRSDASLVNTLIHESVHFTDWSVNHQWDYTDRDSDENAPESAPYMIGEIAQSIMEAAVHLFI